MFFEVFPLALNSAAHLADTLESWQETPLFLRLALAHQEENPAVFATIAEGFRWADSRKLLKLF